MAGDLAHAIGVKGEKDLTLIVKGTRLLNSFPPKAALIADKYLKEHGVRIMYRTPYENLALENEK